MPDLNLQNPIVSIIIPCYNAEKYIEFTIKSVLLQIYSNLEIIIVDDGSTDNSKQIINSVMMTDKRIQYIHQQNSGVSCARNRGLLSAKGDYTLFLDSDDVLDESFILKRVELLEQNPVFGFCSSNVIKIDASGDIVSKNSRGPFDGRLLEEILLYRDNINTCPSIFLIRKKILVDNHITFNTKLSSSADRFFLIELSKVTRGGFIANGAELYYRIHPESMSHHLTEKLIDDNKQYYKQLKEKKYIPENLYRLFSFKVNYIFAGSFFKLKKYFPCVRFSLLAFYYSPFSFIKQLKK